MRYQIPTDLVRMAAAGRLIPFAGAGFSAGVGLPTWRGMLELAVDVVEDGPSFAELEEKCNGNLLQVAEYLFIGSGSHIGPLRQKLSENLTTSNIEILSSPCHVELYNLCAPQVYTTNYDNLIELTYKELGSNCEVVALPRHLALGGASTRPQIVKYHGDLRYEQTLVLTESSYYNRMDFESPMDLKFRSDLLGRSVLFIGYSFSDINIRMIWHKLMQMMKDVPEKDRPTSWIVRFDDNPVQKALNAAAGIQTIELGPLSDVDEGGTNTERLSSFLLDLTTAISDQMPAANSGYKKQFVSVALIEAITRGFEYKNVRLGRAPLSLQVLQDVRSFGQRAFPAALSDAIDAVFQRLSVPVMLPAAGQARAILGAALNAVEQGFFSPGLSAVVMRSLLRQGSRDLMFLFATAYRDDFDQAFPWRQIFDQEQSEAFAANVNRLTRLELNSHERGGGSDIDLLYLYDISLRLRDGLIPLSSGLDLPEASTLDENVARTADLYDGLLADYSPDTDSPPSTEVAEAFQGRLPDFGEDDLFEIDLDSGEG